MAHFPFFLPGNPGALTHMAKKGSQRRQNAVGALVINKAPFTIFNNFGKRLPMIQNN